LAPLTELFPDLELHPGWAPVTIDHLLLNLSGAPNTPPLRRWLAYFDDTRPPPEQRTGAAAEMFALPQVRVGTLRYSNLGYAVAGAAIERIAEEPYESALHTHLLAPLGITSVGFGAPPAIWGYRGRLRLANRIVGKGRPVDPAARTADNPALITPAGRFHLTIADWSRFQRLFLTGAADADGAMLTADSVRRLLAVAPGGPYAMGWAPARGIDAVSFGQQGSNTHWVATALLDRHRRRSAMVIVNDGRTTMLARTARLATGLLTSAAGGPR
jgi:CubicO group peptidase (beta-lactamase class C family)